ncbi:hypothetical protein C8J57DRAFT_1530258 [Mycena rebaudengoi]|nr:hypothetical protein C8J57DRAFT_1530258 [Mycena rebaudengoi]
MDDDDDLHQKEPLVLPSLQYLALGSGSNLDIDITHLISFFARSEAPLQSLSINCRYALSNPHSAAQLFGLIPTLVDLSLIALGNPAVFLELLSSSPHRFLLPQLHVLTLSSVSLIHSHFNLLCTALSARRSQIKTFRYIMPPSALAPDAGVLDNLHALAAEYGMEIHIGHGSGPNYV